MSGPVASRHAIIVVDPQPDFFEGGSLPVPRATATSYRIATFLAEHRGRYVAVVVTQDWHVDPGDHWSDQPDFVTSWPVHCSAGSGGAAIHESLGDVEWTSVIHKGMHRAAYSGFEGESDAGVPLGEVLSRHGVTHVTVVGFATDHCVLATALDACDVGFTVNVPLDLCAGVDPETTDVAITRMRQRGVAVTSSAQVILNVE